MIRISFGAFGALAAATSIYGWLAAAGQDPSAVVRYMGFTLLAGGFIFLVRFWKQSIAILRKASAGLAMGTGLSLTGLLPVWANLTVMGIIAGLVARELWVTLDDSDRHFWHFLLASAGIQAASALWMSALVARGTGNEFLITGSAALCLFTIALIFAFKARGHSSMETAQSLKL